MRYLALALTLALSCMGFRSSRANEFPSSRYLKELSSVAAKWVFQSKIGSRVLLLGESRGQTQIHLADLAMEKLRPLIVPGRGEPFDRFGAKTPRELLRHLAFTPNMGRIAYVLKMRGGSHYSVNLYEDGEETQLGGYLEEVWDLAITDRRFFFLCKSSGYPILVMVPRNGEGLGEIQRLHLENSNQKTFHFVRENRRVTEVVLSEVAEEKDENLRLTLTRAVFRGSGMEYDRLTIETTRSDYQNGEGVRWIGDTSGTAAGTLFIGTQMYQINEDFELEDGSPRRIDQVEIVNGGYAVIKTEAGFQHLSAHPKAVSLQMFRTGGDSAEPKAVIQIPKSTRFLAVFEEKTAEPERLQVGMVSGFGTVLVTAGLGGSAEAGTPSSFSEVHVAVSKGFDRTVFILGKRGAEWFLLRTSIGAETAQVVSTFRALDLAPLSSEYGGPLLTVLDANAVAFRAKNGSATQQVLVAKSKKEIWTLTERPLPYFVGPFVEGALVTSVDCNLLLSAGTPGPRVERIYR